MTGHDGAATRSTLARRFGIACVLLVAAPLLFAGCHDEEQLRSRLEGPTARLPIEPDQPSTPPAPALLDTVRPWRQPKLYAGNVTDTWGLVTTHVDDETDITYRVPQTWTVLSRGRSHNVTDEIDAHARVTKLRDSETSLASYAAQLAEGNPIFQYATSDGHIVYLTRREVALAPSEPGAPRAIFHTAVVSIDGKIAKLDVRFDRNLVWRFDELADAITGTLQVRPRGEQS